METKKDIYQIVTDKIIQEMGKGEIPWHKPWSISGAVPQNFVSKRKYRGVNVWLLLMERRLNPNWVSFKQCKDLGGRVRKGEKATLVVFWNWYEKPELLESGLIAYKRIPFLKYFHVFNCDQCEGLPREAYPIKNQIAFEPIEACEKLIQGYKDHPEIRHEKQQAFYSPVLDYINLPLKESFESIPAFYSTLFHELAHSTGHEKRLARPGIKDLVSFGSHEYSKEELVAEMSAGFLSGLAGIDPHTIKNSAGYMQGWLHALKNDKRMLISAACQAQKAVDYILGEVAENPEAETQQENYLQAA